MSKERYNQIIDEVYTNYINKCREELDRFMEQNPGVLVDYREDTKELFIRSIKDDKHWFSGEKNFSEKWGLKIEERELNMREAEMLSHKNSDITWEEAAKLIEPTKLITLTYNNETIEVYE